MAIDPPRSVPRPGRLSAPVTNEAERAEFQQRVIFTLRISFALAALLFGLVSSILVLALRVRVSAILTTPATLVLLIATVTTLAAWLLARTRRRSTTFLDVIATVTSITVCWAWGYTCTLDSSPSGAFVALFFVTCTLAMHAALIPSTTVRTAALGVVTLLPLVLVSYFRRREIAPNPGADALGLALICLVGLACVTAISNVIYGLRREAQSATQLGQYILDEKIGEGGMGVVYRARHAMLRRPTAIKLISTANETALARFEREVQMTARLRHPNTIAIFDYGRTPDDIFYYAMEFLDGVGLDELVKKDGVQSASRVVHILLQVCGSLEEAHETGLVHRDIKPANIMLSDRVDAKDVVKVLDFGLVKDTSPNAKTSSTNVLLGTPYFMAPETILNPEDVDRRTDLYAVGATAYFLLTGRHVFEGSTYVEICSAHVHQAPIPLTHRNPRIPESLDAVVLRCLAKKQEDRPQTAAELGDLLRKCDVPAWTRENAAEATERFGRAQLPRPRDVPTADTITVSLDGRRS